MHLPIAACGHDLPVRRLPVESFDGLLNSETWRMPYAKASAKAAIKKQGSMAALRKTPNALDRNATACGGTRVSTEGGLARI